MFLLISVTGNPFSFFDDIPPWRRDLDPSKPKPLVIPEPIVLVNGELQGPLTLGAREMLLFQALAELSLKKAEKSELDSGDFKTFFYEIKDDTLVVYLDKQKYLSVNRGKDLDIGVSEELYAELKALKVMLSNGEIDCEKIAFDFSRVNHLDEEAVGSFVSFTRGAQKPILMNLNPRVFESFTKRALDGVINIGNIPHEIKRANKATDSDVLILSIPSIPDLHQKMKSLLAEYPSVKNIIIENVSRRVQPKEVTIIIDSICDEIRLRGGLVYLQDSPKHLESHIKSLTDKHGFLAVAL